MNLTKQSSSMKLNLHTWRGYSAYEIALQHGFEGTEEEWLQSLHGRDGLEESVNGVSPDEEGHVLLTGENIAVSASDPRTLAQAIAACDALAQAVAVTEDGIDLGGKYIDNALFR